MKSPKKESFIKKLIFAPFRFIKKIFFFEKIFSFAQIKLLYSNLKKDLRTLKYPPGKVRMSFQEYLQIKGIENSKVGISLAKKNMFLQGLAVSGISLMIFMSIIMSWEGRTIQVLALIGSFLLFLAGIFYYFKQLRILITGKV